MMVGSSGLSFIKAYMICGEVAPSFDLSFGSLWLTPVSLLQFDMRFSAFQPSEAIFCWICWVLCHLWPRGDDKI